MGTTGLVPEAYLKLVRLDRMQWQNRAHFFAIAAQAMRNILVDYAVRRKAQKRGGDRERVSFEEDFLTEEQADEVLALHEALESLKALDARQASVVECRFFGDLTIDETAEVLGVSNATVSREWALARAWLNREVGFS
jgi:RNA polymerase sigma factor (TIGR02999 family)